MPHGFEHADALLRAITEHLPDLLYAKDRQGRLTYVNPAVMALLGPDALGRSIRDFPIPESQMRVIEENDERVMTRGGTELVHEAFGAPGAARVYQAIKAPLRDASGEVIGLIGISRDVTEAHTQAELLRRSEEHFRAMADDLPLIVWMHDAEGRQQFVNRTFCEYFGLSPEDVRDHRWRLLTHPDDGTAYAEEFFRCVQQRVPFHASVRVRRGDGQWRWIESWGRPRVDAAGTYLGHLGTSADVTEAREAMTALRRKEQELQRIADNSPDIIARVDRDLRHVFVNSAITGAGLRPEDLIGRTHREAGLPEGVAAMFEAVQRAVLDSGTPRQFAFTFEAPDGPRQYEARLIPERDEAGQITHLLGLTQDVTEARRLAEEREQLLEAERAARKALQREVGVRDEFLATLSHELRTPLNAIVGWVSVLRRGAFDEAKLQHGLAVIERNAHAQAQLIDELLDVNRMLSGKLKLALQPVDLNDIVRAAADTVGPAAATRAVTLRLDVSPDLPCVTGDPHRLQQVVWNLLSNAVKFTPAGGHVQVETELDADAILLRVQDTGEGLSADFLPFVFDRFRQADASAGRRHGGLGLGLAISRQLVELHGGTVVAESDGPNRGSTFTVRLPLTAVWAAQGDGAVERDVNPDAARTASGAVDAPMVTDLDVLVVDDQPDALDLCARVLQEAGARVRTACSAVEALEAIQHRRPQVLVSDIGMPNMDGYALVRHVRQQMRLAPTDLPALAVSAFSRADDRRRALEAGYQAFLVKPLSLTELTGAVAALSGAALSPKP